MLAFLLCGSNLLQAQALTPADWGAPEVTVSHTNGLWTIAGKTNVVTLNDSDLAMSIQNGGVAWSMVPSGATDLLAKSGGKEFYVRLAE